MYLYGMKYRPFGIGCQPKKVEEVREDPTGKYWSIIVYKNKLTEEDIYQYELEYIGEEKR